MFISYTTTSGSEYRIGRSQKGQRNKRYADGHCEMQPVTNVTVFLTRETVASVKYAFEHSDVEAIRFACDEIPRDGYHPFDIFDDDYQLERNKRGAIVAIIWKKSGKKNGRDFHFGHSIVAGSQVLHR
jgi:hypothetical protein